MPLLAIALVAAFAFLCALHVYWAFGGKLSLGTAIPEVDGKPLFQPGPIATLFVAGVLAGFAIVAWRLGVGAGGFYRYAGILIGVILVIRALGDFRYVGFTKRVRNTPFARLDTWLFSPVAGVMGVGMLVLAL